ncbi:hypothetical protein TCAL_07526 [Tigriopus californicus]|uniref:Uncharacterized protein n=1 Tax=Tigriopus californicus TaxID=6832 RepID=A0A553NZP8_TIGCA|nr:hypothetical protein TCAL_07526 [Tigriopus californicus]
MLENFHRKTLITSEFVSEFVKAKDDNTTPIHIIRNHPVFPVVLDQVKNKGLLHELWFEHLDSSLVKESSSYKILLGFSVLEKILELDQEPAEMIKYLSPNVVETSLRLLTRLESSPEEDAFIFGVLAKFGAMAKDKPEIQEHVLHALLSKSGNIAFDKITGGNVVHQVVTFCNKEAVKEVGSLYRNAVLGVPNEGREYTAKERVYSAFQLAKLVAHPSIQEDNDWRAETLSFLLLCTHFEVQKVIPPLTSVPAPFAREAKLEIKSAFYKALDFKTKNFESMTQILRQVALFANKFVTKPDKSGAVLLKALDAKSLSAWKTMIVEVEAIENGVGSKMENSVFQLLYLQMGFQLFTEPALAVDTLIELKECHKRSTQRKAKKKVKTGQDEPQWVEVVVDLLLSLLSQNKHHLRQLVNSVFVMLCPHLTLEAIQTIAEDSIDMDDIADDDMKKMDEMLANVFRLLSKKKGGAQKKKEKKDALAIMHFKIRALDMIDVYVSHQPKADHVLFIMSFVFNALEKLGNQKEQKPMVTRLQNTLKKMCNMRKPQHFNFEEGSPDPEELIRLLEYLLELANSGSPLVSQLSQPIALFSQCTFLLLKISQQMKKAKDLDQRLRDVYSQALGNFFHKSICVLPVAFFQLPLQSNWEGSWALVPDIVKHGFDLKTRQFRRTQAIFLLSTLYHNKALVETESKAVRQKIEFDLEQKAIHELKSATETSKPRYLCELFSLLKGLHQSDAKIDWEKVAEALEVFRENVPKNRHFQDVKRAFNRIASSLKLKPITGSEKKKNKNGAKAPGPQQNGGAQNGFFEDLTNGDTSTTAINGTNDDEQGEPVDGEGGSKKKKKKKKPSHETLKAKKEQKLKDVETQLAENDIPSFSNITLSDNMNFAYKTEQSQKRTNDEEDEQIDDKKKRKKRKKDAK